MVLIALAIFFIWIVPIRQFISTISNTLKNTTITTTLSPNDESYISNLRKKLKNENDTVRAEAVQILGLVGDKESIPEIRRLFEQDNKDVKKWTAIALAKLDDKKSFSKIIPELRQLLNDEKHNIRESAVYALGKLDDKESIPGIRRLLSSRGTHSMTANTYFN